MLQIWIGQLQNEESVLGFFGGLFVVLEPGRIFSRLPGLIQVRENRVPAFHLFRFVDVEPHPQWLVGAEGHRSWVVMSCSNNDLCNARRIKKVYYVYCKLEQHEARSEDSHHSWLPSSVRAESDCFHLCLDLQRRSGNRHQSQLSRLLVLLVRCSRCTSTSAAVAAASELPDRALSRHLPSLHPLQHLQHLRVFERCCGCCRPQPTPHPARWLEREIFQSFVAPSLAKEFPPADVQGHCLSKCQKTTKSGNRRPANQATQGKTRSASPKDMCIAPIFIQRTLCKEEHRVNDVNDIDIGKWKASVERDLICSAPLFTEPRESLDAQQPLPRWNSLSWLHLRLAPEVPHAKNGWGSSGLGWSPPERTLKTWKL